MGRSRHCRPSPSRRPLQRPSFRRFDAQHPDFRCRPPEMNSRWPPACPRSRKQWTRPATTTVHAVQGSRCSASCDSGSIDPSARQGAGGAKMFRLRATGAHQPTKSVRLVINVGQTRARSRVLDFWYADHTRARCSARRAAPSCAHNRSPTDGRTALSTEIVLCAQSIFPY